MTRLCIALLTTTLLLGTTTAPAAGQGLAARAADPESEVINTTCPISREPIDPQHTVEYDGDLIAFCCGRCPRAFEKWSDERKDGYVQSILAERESDPQGRRKPPEGARRPPAPGGMAGKGTSKSAGKGGKEQAAEYIGDPYPLATCPVSGNELGAIGEPVIKVYDGRQVRFCCKGCPPRFELRPGDYWERIDEKIVEQQKPHYPTDTCVVMGDSLTDEGEDIAVEVVAYNRLFRLCCKSCARKLKKEPERWFKKLDEAVAEAQRKDYPMQTCVVSGQKLGSMGEPVEIVVANRLVRFCCAGCKPAFKKDPAKYLAKLEKAWERRGGGAGSGR